MPPRSKVILLIIAASAALLVGGFFLGKYFFEKPVTKVTVVSPIDPVIKIGPIKDIIKETYVAGTPIKEKIKPVDKHGNVLYNEILGMEKVVELEYNVLVRWGYRGDIDEKTVKYDEEANVLTIKEPQLTAFYAKEMVGSEEELGWIQSLFNSTSYDDAKTYDQQANEIIEQAIRNNIEKGREKVQEYLKDEIKKLVKNGTIEVPIKEIYFEKSEEELKLVNEEIKEE